MALGPCLLAFFGLGVVLLPNSFGSSSHFFRTMYTSVTKASQGLPHFTALAYVNDQLLARYESTTRKMLPHIPWMKRAAAEDPRYVDRYTQILQHDEANFQGDLVMLRKRYNQSEGFHTVQMMIACEVRPDGSKGGLWQYGYDGRDFLTFDMETLAWTAADTQAQVIKRTWESETRLLLRLRSYLEEICTEWLQKDLAHREEGLLRKEAPVVKVTRKEDYDGMETLICQAYGFYPREIDVTWTKDGEVWAQDTFHRLVAPNPDGTYHAWLSVRIDSKDRDRYQCHIEHDGLLEPLDLAWEEPASNLGLIVGCVVAALLLIAAVTAGSCIYFKKCQEGYKAASSRSRESLKTHSYTARYPILGNNVETMRCSQEKQRLNCNHFQARPEETGEEEERGRGAERISAGRREAFAPQGREEEKRRQRRCHCSRRGTPSSPVPFPLPGK